MIGKRMQTITKPTAVLEEKIEKSSINLGHESLLKCLHFIFDSFDGSGISFFLVRDTAKQAINDESLSGDHLDIGVRKAEWTEGQQMILPYFENMHVKIEKNNTEIVSCEYEGVPFIIHIYPDSEALLAPSEVTYEHEAWNIPNRIDLFEKEHDVY